ncbi:Ribonuclease H-like superfamily [Sesbania bispinosa]|nr:Ribonuclease H-like superfamily [Sesbania bispinosa]
MFSSNEWLKSKLAKDRKGKEAATIVYMSSFWNDNVYSLKAMGPLVRVLRLVHNEKKLAMDYIYEAMDRDKEAIQKSFNENEDKYKEIFVIIDIRWECQLHHPLHSAGHFLNPKYFYRNQMFDLDPEVMGGLSKCIEIIFRMKAAISGSCNEWLVGEMGRDAEEDLVFYDDNLTWGDVANVTGVREPLTYTRRQTRLNKTTAPRPSSSRGKGRGKEVIEENDEET